MKVREIMTSQLASAAPDTTAEELATMMRDMDTGAIPVVDGEELRGIVTDRDIVLRCVATGGDPSEMTAEEIVSEDLETVQPDSDVEEAAKLMAKRQIRRLPVVQDGRLVGMVSLGDIAVKGEEEDAADALENVSEGVKATKVPQAARRAQPARAERHDARPAQHVAPRGETGSTSEIARRGTKHTGVSRGDENRQEISNRSAKEEERRQARVVNIREGREGKGKKAS